MPTSPKITIHIKNVIKDITNNVKGHTPIAGDIISHLSFGIWRHILQERPNNKDPYEELYNKGINLIFLKEPHINTDTYRKILQDKKISLKFKFL